MNKEEEPLFQNWINVIDVKPVEKSVNDVEEHRRKTILDLPVEVILHIFSYLPSNCLVKRVTPVCKLWNKLSKDRFLWKCLSLDFNKLKSFNSSIFLKFPYLQKLSIQQGDIGKDWSFLELSNLQNLSLRFCKIADDAASAFESFFHKNALLIIFLDLEGSDVCSEILDNIFILKFLRQLNLSHCLQLDNSSLIKILETCSQLELLDLDGNNFLSDYAINSIFRIRSDSLISITIDGDHLSDDAFVNLRDCSKVSTLYIAFCENLTDKILHQITNFKHLEHLKLRKGNLFTSAGLNALFRCGNLTEVTHLNMSECSSLDDSNLIAIANCCHKLISLNLSWCWEITDESLCYLVKKCPYIMIMNLTGLVRIQGDFILDLKQGLLKFLRVVDVEQCGGVKDETLFDLVKVRPRLKIFSFWGDLVTYTPVGYIDDD